MNNFFSFIIENLEIILIVIAIIIVAVVLYHQIKSFNETKKKISQLADFFPNDTVFSLIQSSITKEILQSKAKLKDFIDNPPKRQVSESRRIRTDNMVQDNEAEGANESEIEEILNDESFDVDLIKVKDHVGSEAFNDVIFETNAYLCKNVGTSAEFSILQDICERKIESLEAQISSTINVPLYLGLAGTFIGIITGLVGIAFNVDDLLKNGEMSPLRNLLIGVVIAMIASFVGLFLMILNSSYYKDALSECNRNKNGYFDFIRRELMPVLSNSMASSLNSLKGVLGEFVGKFGQNLNAYVNSAELLNDNIERQHLLLIEINKMNQTKVASQIAETFSTLKESSDSLNTFHTYQNDLNNTITKVDQVVSNIDNVIKSFEDFSNSLKVVVANQEAASRLQIQFQSAIETHFPTGSEAREMWRKQFDVLSTDATKVSQELNEQLRASTEYIRSFVQDNQTAFSSLSQLNAVLSTLQNYSNIQATCYSDLKEEIKKLKEAQEASKSDYARLNGDLLIAVQQMISAIKNIKN